MFLKVPAVDLLIFFTLVWLLISFSVKTFLCILITQDHPVIFKYYSTLKKEIKGALRG